MSLVSQIVREIIAEARKPNRNIQKMGRAKIIRIRIRGGKIQRRKKLSAVKGYTIRGGKMIRIGPRERLKRKLGARRAKIKRRAKLARALIRRKRTMRRRKALGLK
jgi:hypothetical protein